MAATRGMLPLVLMCMWRVMSCTGARKRSLSCSSSLCACNGCAGSTGTRGVPCHCWASCANLYGQRWPLPMGGLQLLGRFLYLL